MRSFNSAIESGLVYQELLGHFFSHVHPWLVKLPPVAVVVVHPLLR